MLYHRFAFLLAGMLTGIIGCQESSTERTNEGPATTSASTESFSGTFWIDRWGQGRFPPSVDYVNEALFPKLRDHTGIPILLTQAIAWPETVPGDLCLTEFEGLDHLPRAVSIQLAWTNPDAGTVDESIIRTRHSQDLSFKVQVTNNEDFDLTLTAKDFDFLRSVRHPGNFGGYGSNTDARRRGILRNHSTGAPLAPQDTKYTLKLMNDLTHPHLDELYDIQVPVKAGATVSWTVTISDWEPNEYELMVVFSKDDEPRISGGPSVYSNRLSLDVLTNEPRKDDVVEMHVRQRENSELKPGQPVPLEIVFHNRSETEMVFPFSKGTKDDLDLSDMLFCYGSDGHLLPITSKVAGPIEIRISVNESFTLPVDAPAGTVVARAVFYNSDFSSKISSDDPGRFLHGWHWSEHWQHPTVREQVP